MWMKAIGGPANGRWFDVPPDHHQVIVREVKVVEFREWTPDRLPEKSPMAVAVAYEVHLLAWPGFRFPVRFLFAPGVKLNPGMVPYDSSWPNPLVRRRCRCLEITYIAPTRISSCCHLDHCPVHGRWTFPPITPMFVSQQARERWLKEREIPALEGPKP